MSPTEPASLLVVTADPALLEELSRLAAAAGCTPDVAADPATALRRWTSAGLVLLGADLADELARLAPARRPRVHVVTWGAAPDELFRTAVAVGAEDVSHLPSSAGWLTELLTDLGDSRTTPARTLAVLGGSGGAGASTLACALGQVAAREGASVVIDLDPLGPGLDRMLGLEAVDGVRWDALCHTTGRLSARSLREALPRRHGLGVLTWWAEAAGPVPAYAVREALSAARRGHETVVVDLPRGPDPLVDEVVSRADLSLVVVAATVAGVASAARLCRRFPDRSALRLVVRGTGLADEAVARATGVPVAIAMGDQRGLAEAIDLGLGPVRSRRGPLGRAASELLGRSRLMPSAA